MKKLFLNCIVLGLIFLISSSTVFRTDKKSMLIKPLIFADFFSPNGDGHNDFFHVENIEEYPINKMFIFNRWGETVYVSEPYNNDWDGTMNIKNQWFGKVLPEGMYYWRFEYIIGDFPVKANGKIILKR